MGVRKCEDSKGTERFYPECTFGEEGEQRKHNSQESVMTSRTHGWLLCVPKEEQRKSEPLRLLSQAHVIAERGSQFFISWFRISHDG